MSFRAKPYSLKGKIQNYAWGTKNENAFIPQFLNFKEKKDQPYAELWMGAHPSAPSEILYDNTYVDLENLIKEFPAEILGEKVYSQFGKLPFLFKVLSAGEALSIQAHPNKVQAVQLHARDPEHYPDDNHKPEIAIALSDLTALAGFKTFKQLIDVLDNYPEITEFIGSDILDEMKQGKNLSEEEQKPLVKKMFSSLMKKSQTHPHELLEAIENLDARFSQKGDINLTEQKFCELRKIYPGTDSGLFSLFLLNMIHLKPGQGIFLKAGLPHAYLKGNIVECMANSDNVVRAGLTPKYQDVDTLIDILTYETSPVEIQEGNFKNDELVYETPVSEFRISRMDLDKNKIITQEIQSLQILLVTEGCINISRDNENEEFKKSQAILIPAVFNHYNISASQKSTLFKVLIP